MVLLKATTLPPTTTPERIMVGLMGECGNHSETGYCVHDNSACMPSADDVTWRCRCIAGYILYKNSCRLVRDLNLFPPTNVTVIAANQFADMQVQAPNWTAVSADIYDINIYPYSVPFLCTSLNGSLYLTTKSVLMESRYLFNIIVKLRVDYESFDLHLNLDIIVPRHQQVIIIDGTMTNQTIAKVTNYGVSDISLEGDYQDYFRIENGLVLTNRQISFTEMNLPETVILETSVNVTEDGTTLCLVVLDIIIMRQYFERDVQEHRKTVVANLLVNDITKVIIEDSDSIAIMEGSNFVIENMTDFENGKRHYNITTLYGIASSNIVINILDSNDNGPVFQEEDGYVFNVAKSGTKTTIGVVAATDIDTVGKLEYSIPDHIADDYFDIDNIGVLSATTVIRDFAFPVEVSDGVHIATTQVSIIIKPLIDKVLNQNFTASINEGEPVGTFVISVKIPNYVNYRLSANKELAINNDTGVVTTLKEFDREKESKYRVTVSAYDNSGVSCSLDELGTLEVKILDINDNKPEFSENSYTGIVMEDEYNAIVKINKPFDVTDKDETTTISFYLEDIISGKFRINTTTGIIYTSTKLDREMIDSYRLKVIANDSLNIDIASVNVTVKDINDNRPRFILTNTSFEISENSKNYYINATATDIDQGQNRELRYFLYDADGYFIIDEKTGIITSTKQGLDREKRDQYIFNCTVCDQGDPEQCETAVIHITLIDKNDEIPYLVSPTDIVVILENTYCVINISFADKDVGINSQLTYTLMSHKDIFAINASTGTITCKRQLDFEKQEERRFDIVVSVSDGGQPKNTKNETIIVTVKDENDNYPQFVGDVSNYNLKRKYFETSRPVALVSAVDQDSGVNGDLKYLVIGGNGTNLVKLDETNGFLETKVLPNSENLDSVYDVIIQVSDQGSSPKTANRTLFLFITIETNTGLPVISFNATTYTFNVPENISGTEKLATLGTFVSNGGENLTFTFAGTVNDGGGVVVTEDGFSLARNTGDFLINGSFTFDREEKSAYKFVVIASNTDSSDIALIEVNLDDVNDNIPVFERPLYVFNFNENDPNASSSPRIIFAEDKDSGSNGEVVYEIDKSGNDCASMFKITSDNYVQVTQSLDYETFQLNNRHLCELKIKAFNPDNRQMSAETEVHVYLRDVNDFPPIFYKDDGVYNVTQSRYTITVNEDSKIRHQVKFGWVSDADTGINQEFTLSVSSQTDCPFQTDSGTAINNDKVTLTLRSAIDYETKKNYTCIIEATDTAPPYLNSSVILLVVVEDSNDNSPEVTGGPFNFTVKRDAQLQYVVVHYFNVTDADSGKNAELFFSTDPSADEWQYFDISSEEGRITVAKSLIDLQKDTVVLTVIVKDKGDVPKSTTFQVTIEILDENFRPYFSVASFSTTLVEHTENTSALIPDSPRFKAKDTIKLSNGQVAERICNCTYRFAEPNSGLFIINENNGIVYLANGRTLDREVVAQYNISIIARDRGEPRQDTNNTLTLYVIVGDINDQVPTFSQSVSTIETSIFQNIPIGTPISTVPAIDRDVGINAITKYSIGNVSVDQSLRHLFNEPLTSLFYINDTSSEIFTNGSFDVNITTTFDIYIDVRAMDINDPEKYDTMRLIIPVKYNDPNEYPPEFSKDIYEAHLTKDSKANDLLVRVVATDNDTDAQNQNITYEIIEGNVRDSFRINQRGQIYIRYAPDSSIETVNPVSMIVIAQDSGIIPKTGTCTVLVTIDTNLTSCFTGPTADASISKEYEVLMYFFVAMSLLLLLTTSVLIYKYCTIPRRHYPSRDLQSFTPKNIIPDKPGDFDANYLGRSAYDSKLWKPYSDLHLPDEHRAPYGYEEHFNIIDDDDIDRNAFANNSNPPLPPPRPPQEPAADYDEDDYLQGNISSGNQMGSWLNSFR